MSAPRSRRYSADACCPPWHAHQKAFVISLKRRWNARLQEFLDPLHQAECRRLPERRLRPALDEPASRLPLPERDGIGQWSTASDDRSRRFDVGSSIEKRIEHVDVIAAGGPVKRCLRVGTGESRVHIGAGIDQHGDARRPIWKVSRPVGRHVQKRAAHLVCLTRARRTADPGGGQSGVLVQQAFQRGEVPLVNRINSCVPQGLVLPDHQCGESGWRVICAGPRAEWRKGCGRGSHPLSCRAG